MINRRISKTTTDAAARRRAKEEIVFAPSTKESRVVRIAKERRRGITKSAKGHVVCTKAIQTKEGSAGGDRTDTR